MKVRHLIATLTLMAGLAAAGGVAAQVVGERHLVIAEPSAAVRNADASPTLKATVWYPAEPTARTASRDVGPAGDPYVLVGQVAPDAPFASSRRYAVILFSHGFNGSAQTTAWFGLALARAGYVVISIDHPGNNLVDPQTPGGALLGGRRADDMKAALAAVEKDPTLGAHVDPQRVGVAGWSMGGLTALLSAGGLFDGKLYDQFCATHTASACPPAAAQPLFDPAKPGYPPALQALIAHMGDDRSIPAAKAAFVMAPAPVVAIEPESLRNIKIPVTLIVGSEDAIATPDVGAALGASLIPHAKLVVVPGANHTSFFGLCSKAGLEAKYLDCATARQQELAHRMAVQSALALFNPILNGGEAAR